MTWRQKDNYFRRIFGLLWKDRQQINNSGYEQLAIVTRSGFTESIHFGHLIALNEKGEIIIKKGDPDAIIFARSALKSLQAAAMLRNGLQVNQRQLALICASHSGSQAHIEVARSILKDHGLSEADLKNAKDRPLGESERINWGTKPAERIAHNCSGKHAGMLATCTKNNWDKNTYLNPDHPLQIAIKTEIENMAGEKITITSIDGCGAPLFGFSIAGLARSISNLIKSTDPIHKQIVAACQRFPELVAGENRLTTRMMKAVPGLFMKEGAEGVEVCALADGRTIAMKIIDGSWRPVAPIIQEIFKRWNVAMPDETVKITGGEQVVGQVVATI
jgi:L-asparaginase II